MAKHPPSEQAGRLIRLRENLGYDVSAEFAALLGISPQRWNNFENGTPLSKDVAFILVKKVPGLTLDYLFLGRPDGLPIQLARTLGATEAPP